MLYAGRRTTDEERMTEPSIKELQGERNRLWAEARLKGLPVGTPQRDRIAALDALIRARKDAAVRG